MKKTKVLARQIGFAAIVLFAVIVLALTACSSDGGTTIIEVENDFELDPDGWTVYKITFESDGGSEVEPILAVVYGSNGKKYSFFPTPVRADVAPGLYVGTNPGYTFDGWLKPDGEKWNYDTDKITSDTTLTAKWIHQTASPVDLSSIVGANIIEKSITYIKQETATNYTLVLDADLNVGPITYDAGKTLTITSNANAERKITTTGGSVFIVNNNGTSLIIGGYITLQGKSSNNASVVQVTGNGKLELKGYAKITGNSGTANGSGIYCNGGIITMSENALISNNKALSRNGGGVHIASGYFTMNGGEISGNSTNGIGGGSGGGVYIANSANAVFVVADETVKANIKNNTATGSGPQVYKEANGIFTVGGVPATTF